MSVNTSNAIFERFLRCYSDKSQIRYRARIEKMLDDLQVKDVRMLNIEHYAQLLHWKQENLGATPFDYCNSFFKYLYAYNHLTDPTGFEHYFSVADIKKNFEKPKSRKKAINSEANQPTKLHIPLESIIKIEEYLSQDQSDMQFLKMAFLWHLLYNTTFDIVAIRSIKAKTYNGTAIQIGDDMYIVPQRYRCIFEDLLNHPSRDGFDVNKIIKRLGDKMGIPDLKPVDITQAQKQNKLLCCNCGRLFQNNINNWTAINGKLMCVSCAELLKKNDNFFEESVNNLGIAVFSSDEILHMRDEFTSFDELSKQLPEKIDYLALHEYQIQIGNLGEQFVYEYEIAKLEGTQFVQLIDKYKAFDPKNGYDILSFDLDGHEIYIEVKTTVAQGEPFFMSDTEKRIMQDFLNAGKDYRIYRVENVRAKNKGDIKLTILLGDELKKLKFETNNWVVRYQLSTETY